MKPVIASRSRSRIIRLTRIVSGGQTGVDRAALDAAIAAGIETGGWCPRDRRSEDGSIPVRYPLRETASKSYAVRTEWNVRDSDATLILVLDRISSGTRLTIDSAKTQARPLRIEYLCQPSLKTLIADDVSLEQRVADVVEWIGREQVKTLNVAGPRGSSRKDVYQNALKFLTMLFEPVASNSGHRKSSRIQCAVDSESRDNEA
jgi:hypothetical protein